MRTFASQYLPFLVQGQHQCNFFFMQRYSVRMYEIFVPFKGFLVNTNTGHLGITPVSFKFLTSFKWTNEQYFHIHVYVWTECRHSNNHLLLDNFTGCLYNCYQVISQVGLHLSDQSWGGHSFNSWLCKTWAFLFSWYWPHSWHLLSWRQKALWLIYCCTADRCTEAY